MSQSVRSARPVDAPAAAPRGAVVLLALLLASLVARLVFTIWEGPFDGTIDVADAARAGYWQMNLYVGGPGYIVSFVAAAVFLVLLGRHSVLACVSALLVSLGGIVFGLVITAEALPFVLAVDPAVLPAAEGAELVGSLNGRLDLLLPTILGSTAVIALGGILGLVAALRAGTTPRWFVPAAQVAVVASLLLPVVGLTIPGYLLELAALAETGWFGTAVTRRS
ncbi:hypothetical protein GCM10023162_39890 [Klenkia terrae]